MLTITNNVFLAKYKKTSEQEIDVKNFRLFYDEKPTNLIWYDGKIVFLPKEYFLLKNLINISDINEHKCSLFAYDVNLIDELKEKNVDFVLDGNLKTLLLKINMFPRSILSDEVSIELTSDQDYSKINEPIYLGNGVWMNA